MTMSARLRLVIAAVLATMIAMPAAYATSFVSASGAISYGGLIGAKADVYQWNGSDSFSTSAPTLPTNGGVAFDGDFSHTGIGGCCSGLFAGTAGVHVHSLADYAFNGTSGFTLTTNASIVLTSLVTGPDAGITIVSTGADMNYDFRFSGTGGTPFHFVSNGLYDQYNVMYFWDMTLGTTFAQTSGSGRTDNPLSFDVSGTLIEGDIYELYIGLTSPDESIIRNTFATLTVGDQGAVSESLPEPATLFMLMSGLGAVAMMRRRRH